MNVLNVSIIIVGVGSTEYNCVEVVTPRSMLGWLQSEHLGLKPNQAVLSHRGHLGLGAARSLKRV